MICAHCAKHVLGRAIVFDNHVLHEGCERPYNLAQRGLVHECPKCKTSGKVPSKTRTQEIEVALGKDETPNCAYNGCMGCHYCRNHVKKQTVPVQEACDLCKGEGYLTKPARPVTKVVDWEVG